MDQFDVVVVGGGIAGSAISAVIAPAGISVLVLERQMQFRDRVRGEYMHPWGLAEVQRMGLDSTLMAVGGSITTSFVGYDENHTAEMAEAAPTPLGMMVPGVPGGLCVGHPAASEALNSLAAQRGATVIRGVGDVEVTSGPSPSVRYEHDGNMYEVGCRLIVGADGRQSTVRRGLGIELAQIESKAVLGGMLVRAPGWEEVGHEGVSMSATEGDRHVLAFPRADGLVRLYLACDPGPRASGADRASRMLDAFHLECVPDCDILATAEPVGPCSYFVGTDAWTHQPFVEGAVLVGDAAGWNDPIMGEGLSVAMRDARIVSEALLESDDWSGAAFEDYGAERAERMRRLKTMAHVLTEMRCTFSAEGRRRRAAFTASLGSDPMTLGLMVGAFAGPEVGPAEAFAPDNVERVLSLA
jgi:2-polyprenyl-6-methoxyphenol hydroxylase-like FAD-dependent oxidoreductase